jgi:hypothetical protein
MVHPYRTFLRDTTRVTTGDNDKDSEQVIVGSQQSVLKLICFL